VLRFLRGASASRPGFPPTTLVAQRGKCPKRSASFPKLSRGAPIRVAFQEFRTGESRITKSGLRRAGAAHSVPFPTKAKIHYQESRDRIFVVPEEGDCDDGALPLSSLRN
jgi:hypothetical protein